MYLEINTDVFRKRKSALELQFSESCDYNLEWKRLQFQPSLMQNYLPSLKLFKLKY
jgi:hypothetical protein